MLWICLAPPYPHSFANIFHQSSISFCRKLLENNPHPVCYDGFEPSGRMHIAQGVQKAINVNKLTRAGCSFVFWVADWFAQLNNKMDGDLEKIRTVRRDSGGQ